MEQAIHGVCGGVRGGEEDVSMQRWQIGDIQRPRTGEKQALGDRAILKQGEENNEVRRIGNLWRTKAAAFLI